MQDHLAAGIVHLAVDPADMESLMAIRASSIWASEHSLPLKIWPFKRELGNPAADVTRGDTAMERLKARRALARANYRQMEEKRAREYLGLPPDFVVEAETGMRLAAWLVNESAVSESMAGIWSEFEKLLAQDGRSPSVGGGVNEWSAEQGEINQLLVDRGIYTTPSFLLDGHRFVGVWHLPLIRACFQGKALRD
jgi:hypothetical protein